MSRHFFDGQRAHEKMINNTNHQGNTHQNHSEMSSHTCQSDNQKRIYK